MVQCIICGRYGRNVMNENRGAKMKIDDTMQNMLMMWEKYNGRLQRRKNNN